MIEDRRHICGRRAEMTRITAWLADIGSRRDRVLLLAGEAGIGKSRLAAEAIAQAELQQLSGRSRETSSAPYTPIVALLRQCLQIVSHEFVDAHPLGRYLGMIVPELPSPTEPPDRDVLVEAIASLLIQATRSRPAVIYLEDIHWADDATLDILPPLIDRLRDSKVAVIATYRSDEVTRRHPIRRFRTELRRTRQLHEIELQPLDEKETAALIEQVLNGQPAPTLAKTIFQRSQGVPLYIEELAQSLADKQLIRTGPLGLELDGEINLPLPEGIRDTILLRTQHLSDSARALLDTAAIFGDEFSFDELCSLAESDDGLEELIEQQFIVETSPGCGEFRHGLIGESVSAEMTWTKRRSLHRTIAQHLEKKGASPGVLSQHWLQAGEQEKARHCLIAAADLSCRIHAYRDAVRAVNQALEIWPDHTDEELRLRTLERLARCGQMSGQHQVAIKALTEILQSSAIQDDAIRRADSLRQLATVYGLQGAWDRSIQYRLDAAEALLSADQDGDASAELLAAGSRMVATLQLERAIETLARAGSIAARAERWDVAAKAMGLNGNAVAMTGDVDSGSRIAREALNLALDRNLPQAASDVYRRLASSLEYGSRYDQARDAYYEALNYCRAQKADTETHICLSCMSALLFWTGELKQAIEMSQATLDSDHSPEGSKATAEGTLGIIHAFRGETRPAKARLGRCLTIARRLQIAPMELIVLWGLAVAEEYQGQLDRAASRYTELIDRWQTTQDRHDAIPALAFGAAFFGRTDNEAELTRCTAALETIAGETDNPEALAALSTALAEAALLENNPRDAVGHARQAVAHLESVEMPLLHILAHYRLGTALARAGVNDEAATELHRAHHDARRLGFRPLAADIGRLLTELGADVESGDSVNGSRLSMAQSLTARQTEIARLLADGLTNKEIAERLFLSVRTVDMHVRNILDRLDCRSRAEAVKRAGELGILG